MPRGQRTGPVLHFALRETLHEDVRITAAASGLQDVTDLAVTSVTTSNSQIRDVAQHGSGNSVGVRLFVR